ncbi:MAG: hypothetical protein ACQEQE_11215 [Bacillota bacterium]
MLNITKKDLKDKFKENIKKISEINNLKPKVNERVNELYAYLENRKEKGLIKKVNLDTYNNHIAVEGFKNHTYNIQEGDILLFQSEVYPIKGKYKIIELTDESVTLGKLTKKGNISKRANKVTFDKGQIEGNVRNCSELNSFNKDSYQIKEVE